MSRPAVLVPARLRLRDLFRLSSVGIRTRKLRAALSALGIAIGVAAIVAVLGLSASSQAGLLAEINKLGTNLLTVTNGQTLFGQTAELPEASPGMIGRIGPVTTVQYTGALNSAQAFRSPLIPAVDTNAITVDAASLGLPAAVGTTMAEGTYLNSATAQSRRRYWGRRPLSAWASTVSSRANASGSATCGFTSWASSTRPCSHPRSTRRYSSGSRRRRNTWASTATRWRST